MSDLAVIVPSRGRPQNAAGLAEAFLATIAGDTSLWFAVDEDDPALMEYIDWSCTVPDRVHVLTEPRPGSMVAALNLQAVPLAPLHFALGFMGDDHRPRTPGWDEQIVEALKDLGTGIVSGPDGFRADQLPTWCAMTSNIVRTLGYMAPPGLQHMYVDNAWQSLGEALGAYRYLPDVLVEHMHPLAGKAPSDEGYERVNDAGVYARDAAMFARWCRDDLPAAVDKLAVRPGGVD